MIAARTRVAYIHSPCFESPTMTAAAASSLIAAARHLHDSLACHHAQQGTLAPCANTNRLFGQLVDMAVQPTGRHVANQVIDDLAASRTLASLYQICATGEYALEHHWGQRIRQAARPLAELRAFPYWQNYLKLAQLEVKALRRANPSTGRVLFVGAGPLPLTAFIMAKHYGLAVTNLDIDGDAACCAAAWMERILGVGSLPCHHMDVMNFSDFGQYDAVVLAALVGLDAQAKRRVLRHLHTHLHEGQTLLVRSVQGMRRLLYPAVTSAELEGFEITRQIHPRSDVVNSVILARKAA